MKNSDHIQIIKERDRLIEMLILSHLQTLGKVYDIQSKQGVEMCQRLLLNPFSIDEMVDFKRTNELDVILNDASKTSGYKISEFLDEERGQKIANMLKDLARREKSKLLKRLSKEDYNTKY